MPGLLDIAQSTKKVAIAGGEVPVYGVSAKGIAYLFERFPVIRELLTGKSADLSPATLTKLVPDAIAAIIAAGTGSPGDAATEEVAERLPAADQVALLEEILKLTMPQGAGPFVEKLMGLAGLMGVESINIPDMKSPQQSKA